MSTFASKEGRDWKKDSAKNTVDILFNLVGKRLDELLKDSTDKQEIIQQLNSLKHAIHAIIDK